MPYLVIRRKPMVKREFLPANKTSIIIAEDTLDTFKLAHVCNDIGLPFSFASSITDILTHIETDPLLCYAFVSDDPLGRDFLSNVYERFRGYISYALLQTGEFDADNTRVINHIDTREGLRDQVEQFLRSADLSLSVRHPLRVAIDRLRGLSDAGRNGSEIFERDFGGDVTAIYRGDTSLGKVI